MNTEEIATSCLIVGEVFTLPKDHVLKDENGNVINATKIVLEKKKKEYPKTYEECCEIVKVGKEHTLEGTTIRINYKIALLESFQKLLICRDAYWKIAGDWKPKFNSDCLTPKYIMTVDNDRLIKSCTTQKQYILSFPTEEMRDAFYENFKELIGPVKELL